jgi:hypothetical protein
MSKRTKNPQEGTMCNKKAYRWLAFTAFAALLVVPASAQAPPANPITCVSGTACKKSFVPVFNTNGGAATVKDSLMEQTSGVIHVAGGVSATKGGTTKENTIFGSNTSTADLAPGGSGVYGQLSSTGESTVGSAWAFQGAGTWGDGGADSNYGVIGTTDDHSAGIFHNNSPNNYYALFGFAEATGGTGLPWAAFNGDGAGCSMDAVGDLSCTGSKNAVVPVDGGKHQVALSAIESPKNWFEDFGSAQLVGGVATIRLDARFIQTVNTSQEYHVFLTPNGDCKGLYVNQKTANSFEVRELGNGSSSVRFDYRITALRKNYEKVRFADHSREFPMNRDGRIRPATK